MNRPRPALPTYFFLFLALPACQALDEQTCDQGSCFFTREEWDRARGLAGLGAPPLDTSNRLVASNLLDPAKMAVVHESAVQLGWQFYFEKDFSGNATWQDTLGRMTTSARSPVGTPMKISCASCHNPARSGTDTLSAPGHVSVGAGWYDVNGQQTVNAAHYKLIYWNGRSDSLWGQAAAVIESGVSMNGNRLAIAWTVADKWAARYNEIFTTFPGGEALPLTGGSAEVRALLADPASGTGICTGGSPAGDPPVCATAGCIAVTTAADPALFACMPRIPLRGKKGTTAGCQFGSTAEPFGDAFDCMAMADQSAITKVLVNVSKAIGAYEYELRSNNAPFDQFVVAGPDSTVISDSAKRGLQLFVGRASCIDCHNTPFLSDNDYHDIGVPQVGPGVPTVADCAMGNSRCDCVNGVSCLPWGYYDGAIKLAASPFNRMGAFNDGDKPTDPVDLLAYSYNATLNKPPAAYQGQWRTPSLRDIALTAPYMHDGVFRTLEEVIWHYDQGGSSANGTSKAPELRPLFLSAADRGDLVEFLKTLTGNPVRPALHVPPMGGSL